MPMLELGPRRPKKERVPDSDGHLGTSIHIFWILAVGVTHKLETDDDCSMESTLIQTVKSVLGFCTFFFVITIKMMATSRLTLYILQCRASWA
jgi:hypothetical protein